MRSWNKFSVAALAISLAYSADPDPAIAGRRALDLLLAKNFTAFAQLLTGVAKERMTLDFLAQRVGTEIDGFGKAEAIGKPVFASSGSDYLISYPVRFERVTVNVQLTLSHTGMVAGLYFRPKETPLPPVWKRPAYSNTKLFQEREITVGTGEWKLPGTLTVPTGPGPFPAVVLVHGPGPNDRDETLYSNHMFKDIAEGLASRGIVVLRYDKRSKVYGEKMSELLFTLQQETADDAVSALALARGEHEVNAKRVFILGHSLGGYAIPRIAERDGKLAGAIFLAANARPIEDVVLDQNEQMLNLQRADPASQRRLDALRAEVAKVKNLVPSNNNPPVILGLPSAYFLDLKGYNPAAEAKQLSIPMLFLQGERDIQISSKDFDLWKAALSSRKNVTFDMFPPLNHLFMTGEGAPSPTEYRIPGNVSAQVIDEMAKWILKQ